jgi:UDP-N-acetylglucosamine--N-acetylmuramyl-(pentapeptide) pyrophosphoryl-undecaprenol N-acetylglucosamine transferase
MTSTNRTELFADDSPDETPSAQAAPRFVLSGGGSGGHLCPGLAVAESLRRESPFARILFLAPGRAVEDLLFAGVRYERRRVTSLRGPGGYLALPHRAVASLAQSLAILARFRPAAVVGLGGFGSVPPALAARALRIPLVLLEQNAVAGRANVFLSRRAERVYCAFSSAAKEMTAARVDVVGNPTRRDVLEGDREAAYRFFGLEPRRRTLLVLGGSQGASALNGAVIAHLHHLGTLRDGVQAIHVTGARDVTRVREVYDREGVPAFVTPFLTEMGLAYAVADLALSRAGGTTVAELMGNGVPAVLVPYPHHADRHQLRNAQEAVAAGAAVICEEESLADPRSFLQNVAGLLVVDPDRRRDMAARARAASRTNAADTVAHDLLRLAAARSTRCPPESARWAVRTSAG